MLVSQHSPHVTSGQAANEYHELRLTLRESDYALPALKQNTSYIADLQSQISSTDKELRSLHEVTEKERKDHVKYRDSVMRRYAHKLGGHKGEDKFTAKQEKEEKEFLEAWQKEREANERREELGRALERAKKEKQTLESDKSKHEQAQSRLDQMYSDIFTGPTPEVPGEDQLEEAVNNALNWYQQCQEQLGRDKHAAECLERAGQSLSYALSDMAASLSASNVDRFGGGALFDSEYPLFSSPF